MRTRGSAALRSIFSSRPLLLREYIHESLYHPTHGYFSNKQSPLLHHTRPIDFRSLTCRAQYESAVAATYSSRSHGWMTPIELFSPYLSRAIANRLKTAFPSDGDINVIEIGAGRGTLARDILTHWERHHAHDVMPRLSYYIIEISHAMTELQRNTLSRWTDHVVKIVQADAVDWFREIGASARERLNGHCHVVGMEVLDNMPHDLVRIKGNRVEQAVLLHNNDDSSDAPVLQWTDGLDAETLAAMTTFDIMSDMNTPSFTNALSMFESLLGGEQEMWVPTASHRLLRGVVESLPGACMTLADFESFPGGLAGLNGPVVQAVARGSATVFESVEGAPFGTVDIMFPTRFDWLVRGHERLVERKAQTKRFERAVLSQRDMFEEFCADGDRSSTRCQDGYNPVLEDFANAKFFLVDLVG